MYQEVQNQKAAVPEVALQEIVHRELAQQEAVPQADLKVLAAVEAQDVDKKEIQ